MAQQLFKNNAASNMSGSLTQGGTTLVIATGTGDHFPSPTGGDYFLATIFEKDEAGIEEYIEVVKVTARTADTLTIERDFENMTAQTGGFAYPSAANRTVYVELRWTAAGAENFAQRSADLSDLVDPGAARTNLGISAVNTPFTPTTGLEATDVQAAIEELAAETQSLDPTLSALAGVASAADKLAYFTGTDAADVTDLTTYGRSLIGGIDAAAVRSTLGLDSAALKADTYFAQSARTVSAGTGLSGGGDLTANRTISLANTAVAANSYGSATQVGTFTVDAQGRLTAAANVTITPAWSSITSKPTTLSGYGITDGITAATAASTYLTQTTASTTYQPVSAKNAANGYAGLDSSGLVPSSLLPSYVDDVLEYANTAAFPGTGESGKIYVTADTNKTYRWTGTQYVEISASPGSTDSVTEGSVNLYYTNARARAAISVTQNLTYNSSTGVITGPDLSGYLTSATAASTYLTSSTAASTYAPLASPTFSGSITASSGTANGVAYLNGSKVLTTGSALTFDGSAMVLNTSTSTDALRITQIGSGNALVVEDSANPDGTPFVVGSSGKVGIGLLPTYTNSKLQIFANDNEANTLNARGTNDSAAFMQRFYKTRSTNIYTQAIVQNGDALGEILFSGDDGVTAGVVGAAIAGAVDGTPGTNDMPGRLVFSTTADGASSPTERMRIDSAGRVGLTAVNTLSAFNNVTPIQGGVQSWANYSSGVIQSGVTTQATYYGTGLTTAAAAFTLANARHYLAQQASIGAGSTVTTQAGFTADSTLTGATNNFGFISNIASGTGRWNFYAAGTADNYFAGSVGIGGLPAAGISLTVANNITGATNAYGILNQGQVQSDVTSNVYNFNSGTYTAAAAFTLGNFVGYNANQASIGAGSAITNQFGFHAQSTLTGATNNYGFYGNIAAGTGRYNFYAAGTAANYFAGQMMIGSTGAPTDTLLYAYGSTNGVQRVTCYNNNTGTSTQARFDLSTGTANSYIISALKEQASGPVYELAAGAGVTSGMYFTSGATNQILVFRQSSSERMRINQYGNVGIGGNFDQSDTGLTVNPTMGASVTNPYYIRTYATVPSTVTGTARGVVSQLGTAAAAFTLPGIDHFYASQSTFGAGSTVTSQVGFSASSNLTGATNNYGFYSNIASGTGRWNFHAAGTADNYFAGRVSVGATQSAAALYSYAADGTYQFGIAGTTKGVRILTLSTEAKIQGVDNTLTASYQPLTFGGSQLVFETNGTTERMRIDSSGNVSIGNASASSRRLWVEQSADAVGFTSYCTNASFGQVAIACNTVRAANSGFDLFLGQSNSVSQFRVNGAGTIYAQNTTVQSISDVRMKENIVDSADGLNVITALRPVRFDFKDGFGNDRKNQLGFIAQEVEPIFPDAVDVWGESDDPESPYKSVGPGALIPVLVKAIQELKAELDATKAEVAALKAVN